MSTRLSALLGMGICIAGSAGAWAVPVTYTVRGTGRGSVHSIPFENLMFTITAVADTSDIENPAAGLYSVSNSAATLRLEGEGGVGDLTFTVPTIAAVNQNNRSAGVSRLNPGLAIVFANDVDEFTSYDLSTSIGPLTGRPSFNPLVRYPTTGGDFVLTQVFGEVSFEAAVVPEPGVLSTTIIAFGGVLLASRRRRRHGRR